ncbi:uncharacterized mitochondrial protein-like protein, partial [Tanacetum coccineum]
DSGFELTAFLDADHARCIDTRKSTSGGIQFLGEKLVSWMSKKQNCTAMSSAEAYEVFTGSYSSNCCQRGHNKKGCKNETVDPPPKEVRPKGKRKDGQNGFESAASALKRMRMDATASGSGLSKEEDADPANADHANVQEPGEMEQPVHMEEPVQEADVQQPGEMEQPVHMEEPVQEADVQEPVLRRGLRLRRPSQRILLNKWKKPFQFDEHGTGSTAENAFDISDE